MTEEEFLAGCNRFAIDNPVPTITARLAWYGNEDNSTKQVLEQFERRINDREIFDREFFTGVKPG